MINKAKQALTKLQEKINCPIFKDEVRMNKKDFSRKRKQTFVGTIMLLMNSFTKNIVGDVINFVDYIRKYKPDQESFSASAFTQCRKKLKPEAFSILNDTLVEEFYTDKSTISLFANHRLLAVDGSIITLPNNKYLKEAFGETKINQHTQTIEARASVLYDVENKICLAGKLTPFSVSERPTAIKLLAYCKLGDLVIYDRGYPSFELIYEHCQRNIHFLMRVQSNFNNQIKQFIEDDKTEDIVEIYPNHTMDFSSKEFHKLSSEKVRLIRVTLDTGENEILITSLLDSDTYKHSIFKDLYFKRWGIETYYDELKNKLKLENFTGYTEQSILQDFYIALLVSNIQTLIVQEIEAEVFTPPEAKYRYKVNTSVSYVLLRNRILDLLFNQKTMSDMVPELKKLFSINLVPIRPGRSFSRNKTILRKNKAK